MSAPCLFCRIIAREIPGSIVYEDDAVLAFNDINPQAPTHVLVVPKRHIETLNDLRPTVASLSTLLGQTPDLLDTATGLLPTVNDDATRLEPALTFFRPYTPEAIGFLSNWGDAGAPIDSEGHYGHIKGQEGTTSTIGLGSAPPGVTDKEARDPGDNAGQDWTDAEGQTER